METVPALSAGDAVTLWSGRHGSQALRAVTDTRQPRGSGGNVGVPFTLGEQWQLMNKAVEPKGAVGSSRWREVYQKKENSPRTIISKGILFLSVGDWDEKQRVVSSSPSAGKTC